MKKVYATIWFHPNGKWKLDEAIIVEDEKIVGSGVGGSFYFGKKRTREEILKEALIDLLFFDPELDDKEWEKKLEKLKKEVEVEFVSDEEMKKLKEKYPEEMFEEPEEETPRYIG